MAKKWGRGIVPDRKGREGDRNSAQDHTSVPHPETPRNMVYKSAQMY